MMTLLLAVVFNVIGAGAVAATSGLPFLGVLGGGAVASTLIGSTAGNLNMAVQKEIWMSTIVEGLFADDSFLSKAINADLFVNQGRTVHIPNAGAPSGVSKNRNTFPATVTTRTDLDLTFDLDEFTTNPIRIPHADTVELSYDKRQSVIGQDKANLANKVAESFLFKWSPTVTTNIIPTTGDAIAAHTPSATGDRKAFTKKDVNQAMLRFNRDNIPQSERYLLLDADMHSQLLDSMTEKEADAFFSLADLKNGVIGKLYSFNIMMRSQSLRYTGAGAVKDWSTGGAATDNAGALAWHKNSLCRALGEVVMFDKENDPTYYGDIYSFLVRAGGRPMRSDVKGLLAIVQAPSA
jgi:P22 coat protein - gene protein 5.